MKQPNGIAGLFSHSGGVCISCTEWWIIQMISDWNLDNFFLPTLEMIEGKLKKQQQKMRPFIYFGLGSDRDTKSVLQEFTRNAFIGTIQDRDGKDRYYIMPKGQEGLEIQWAKVKEDTLEFKHFFLGDKSLIPKVEPLRQTGY